MIIFLAILAAAGLALQGWRGIKARHRCEVRFAAAAGRAGAQREARQASEKAALAAKFKREAKKAAKKA